MQRFFDVVQNRNGRAIANALVYVRNQSGALATLYSDNGVNTTPNPTSTNIDGEYTFFAANGTYELEIVATGYSSESRNGVILYDPLDDPNLVNSLNVAHTPAPTSLLISTNVKAALDSLSNNYSGSDTIGFSQLGFGAVNRTVRSKLQEVISPEDFGAVGDGITDDKGALQAAINYATSIPGTIIDGNGRRYAIGSQLIIEGVYETTLQNILLTAIAGTWPSGTSGAMIKLLRPTGTVTNIRSRIIAVTLDCNDVAKSGIYVFRSGSGTTINRCRAISFSEYGFWFAATGSGNNDVKVSECTAAEFVWSTSNPKFYNYALRTGVGFFIDGSADMELTNCTGQLCKYGLQVRNLWNGQFIGCKFWNGTGVNTDAASVSVLIEATANRCQFVGCRFDDGAVKLYNFNHSFVGCLFIQFSSGSLNLVATVASETAASLTFVGNIIENSTANLTTEGVGTWGNVSCEWVANRKSDGTSCTIQGYNLVTGNLRQTSTALSAATDDARDNGTSALRWRDTYSTQFRPGAGAVLWTSGSGTPEGVVTAPVGSLFTRTDGGVGTTLYVKQTGTGNTGWAAK